MPKPKKKGKKLDPEKVEQYMQTYTKASTQTMLDNVFGKWDNVVSMYSPIPYLDRADHIIIDGRTASELLVERFNQEFVDMRDNNGQPYPENSRLDAYNAFYSKNAKDLINTMVFEAVSSGKKVEVFVPDAATGQIKKEPMKLTAAGFTSSGPLAKPAQMNRWQKFWNKLGFYKKEKAAVVNYEKQKTARERVQFCNKAARANLTTNSVLSPSFDEEFARYHPEILEDMQKNFPAANGKVSGLGHANGFSTDRTSFHALALGLLANKRNKDGSFVYTNEQLFNLSDPKMQKARADAMKEVYEHYKPGALLQQEKKKQEEALEKGKTYVIKPELQEKAAAGLDWLVDLQHEAADVLSQRINTQAKKLDFSKPELTEQKSYREFALLSDTAFDFSQDMNATRKRMDEKYGKNAYNDASGKVGDWSQISRKLGQSYVSQKFLLNGLPGENPECAMGEISKVFQAQTCQQQIRNELKANPKANFTDLANYNLILASTQVLTGTRFEDRPIEGHVNEGKALPKLMEQSFNLAKEHIQEPEQFNKQIQNGVLESRIKLQSIEGVHASFELRDAKTAERELQQQQKQDAALAI